MFFIISDGRYLNTNYLNKFLYLKIYLITSDTMYLNTLKKDLNIEVFKYIWWFVLNTAKYTFIFHSKFNYIHKRRNTCFKSTV